MGLAINTFIEMISLSLYKLSKWSLDTVLVKIRGFHKKSSNFIYNCRTIKVSYGKGLALFVFVIGVGMSTFPLRWEGVQIVVGVFFFIFVLLLPFKLNICFHFFFIMELFWKIMKTF